jgi:outer membrane protein TolC
MLLCALSCGNLAIAAETADPFSTMGKYTAKPAFSSDAPCGDTMPISALDLMSVVNITLCNNPQTREVWANSRAQAAQVGVTQASYLPTLNASLAENQTSPGVRQRNLGLNLSYLLYDFGARAANLESARQLLVSVNATQNNTVLNLFLAAVQAYYQTRATQAAFAAADASERAAQESFKAANARYLAGSAIPADKLTAQTAYSQATLNRITAHGAMKIAQGTLANLLGLDANLTVLLVADTQSDETNINKNMQDFEQNVALLIEAARRHRPDLLAAEATVKAAEATAEAARAAGKPTISMTAAANQTNSAGINNQSSTLGVSMSVPLFAGYAPTYRIRAAEAQIETKKAQLERIRLQVALDVWTAYQNLLTATQNRRSSADLLSSAAQAERVAVGRFKAGSGIMLDLLNAQTTLASARQQRIQADLNWNISRATLAQSMGNLDAELLSSLTEADTRNTQKP